MKNLEKWDGTLLPFEIEFIETEPEKARALPIVIKPQPDELFTSWLTRLAWNNAEKLHSFKKRFWTSPGSPWGRQLDLICSSNTIQSISKLTCIPFQEIQKLRLSQLAGYLFENAPSKGPVPNILSYNRYGHQFTGHGLQLCPQCIAEMEESYFKQVWRVSLIVVCPKHLCLLIDACPNCYKPIIFHLGDSGLALLPEKILTSFCGFCGFQWSLAQSHSYQPNHGFHQWQANIMDTLIRRDPFIQINNEQVYTLSYFSGIRFLSTLILSRSKDKQSLYEYISIQNAELNLKPTKKIYRYSFESLRLCDRLDLLEKIYWLLQDWPSRFITALQETKIRFSGLHSYHKSKQIPFWIFSQLSQSRSLKHSRISHEEVQSVRKFLIYRNWESNDFQVRKMMGRGSIPKLLKSP